jgi:hypothetical protein
MPVLVWDKVGDRVYETGLDRGVLYLPDGSAVPWNGLTSIIEQFSSESSPVYYDGMKVNELVVLGDFAASMKAVTYPDEFVELEGLAPVRRGIFYADQRPQTFGLCYRTQIGNDLEGEAAGYKIHIIYNVTAIPSEKSYASLTDDPSLVEFEWNITAVPEEVPGFRPTAHIVIDSRTTDPWLLEELEAVLYGNTAADAALIPMLDLVTFIGNWYRVQIVDHGDGTWSAISAREGYIDVNEIEQLFILSNVNAVYLDEDTYQISDTKDVWDIPQIDITDNANGTWTATTDQDNLIVMISDTEFEIRNATADFLDADTYQISDTTN